MQNTDLARQLRRHQTPEEDLIWMIVRNKRLGLKFQRQVPLGPYIVDFSCFARRLVVEVDGSQHADCAADVQRDAWLASQGYRVLRFWNPDVRRNLTGVRMGILEALGGG